MKALYYIGMVIFGVGIVLFFLKEFKVAFVQNINESLINIMWPMGMILYGFAMIFLDAEKKKAKE